MSNKAEYLHSPVFLPILPEPVLTSNDSLPYLRHGTMAVVLPFVLTFNTVTYRLFLD
jgi:hypothetical protein